MRYLFITLSLCCLSITARADLITNPGPAPSPTPLTLAQKESAFAFKMRYAINGAFQNLVGSMKSNQHMFWSTDDGLTPQQHFNAMGVDQCSLRKTYVATVAYLNALKPGLITGQEPAQVSMSGTGNNCTVTVTPWPSPSPSPISSENP